MTPKLHWQLHSPLIHAAMLVAISLSYFTNLGKSSIWDINEAFYAETPREMLITGDYLAPQFNFEPRAQKPPLAYWAVLASYKLFGINEFAVRFPGAVAVAGTLLFIYGLALLLFNPRTALMAALITATTARIFILARRSPIDILLLFFLMGTLFFLVRAIQKNETCSWALAYLCAGLGFLTKGPIAVIIPAGAYLIWVLWGRQLRFSMTHPLMGGAIFLGVALPWYALIYRAHGWTYISPFFLRDNLGRFATETLGPSRGLFYYLSVYAVDFFPWSLLALFAVYLLWTNRKAELPLKNLSFGLPLVWCGLTFLLFSISKNKQEYYIAPIYPVAAVILAGVLDRTLFKREHDGAAQDPVAFSTEPARSTASQVWLWPYAFCSFLLIALSVLLPFVLRSFVPLIHPVLHYGPSLVFGGAGILMAVSLIRGNIGRCFPALAISMGVICLMYPLFYLPAAESFRPVKDFCRLIEAQSHGNDEAGYYGTAFPSMAYYLRRPIYEEDNPEQMRRRFESSRRVFCILKEGDYRYFLNTGGPVLHVLDRRSRIVVRMRTFLSAGHFAEEELLLVSNQPNSETEFIEDRPRS